MSSYAAFTLLKTPPRNHLKLHWRTHILSVPQLHVKNIILLEKRLVRFPLSSGTVMIVRKQSIPKKTITTDKQDSCLNQVHGVCFGMRLRQEPSPGFTAGRQYKTTDSSIAKGSYFQPYWTHTSSTQCSHYAQHGICKFVSACKFNHSMSSYSSLADMHVAP
ncbi:unnamed protein product [Brassica napus]|uniref:(rape) hypothetical protein n=1 Tax=Brassica napus TaxID=3708 RepID=A0A816X3V7_BRANA|nr:unnamed protein product [Brassica napus]